MLANPSVAMPTIDTKIPFITVIESAGIVKSRQLPRSRSPGYWLSIAVFLVDVKGRLIFGEYHMRSDKICAHKCSKHQSACNAPATPSHGFITPMLIPGESIPPCFEDGVLWGHGRQN